MDLQCLSVCLSVCVSGLINGSLPEAVSPAPSCPPFIIHFNPQQKAACPRLGADGALLLSMRSCLAGTCMLYKPVSVCLQGFFVCCCLFVLLFGSFLFSFPHSPSPPTLSPYLFRFILPGFQHILRTQTLLWAQFLFH